MGVDGSDAGIAAALWAVDEAVTRDVPLLLMSVIKATHPTPDDYYEDVHHAEAALSAAQKAVESTGQPVKLETAVASGQPAGVLIARSSDAHMVCVGSAGIDGFTRSILGSTAADLAEKAQCPVAVIRPPRDDPSGATAWIVVPFENAPADDAVIEQAMREAKLRRLPVLLLGRKIRPTDAHDALGRVVEGLRSQHPDVHVYPISDRADIARFLREHDDPFRLAVIGGADAKEVPRILGAHDHPGSPSHGVSVLVVRP
ncbi:universal stress protein [Mycobacterium sp. NPDC050551]|uniref:universal stress protein n=1 Tax=Mycobacterium sp. NPDC050551 TaxID=3155407 RepID=UPI00342635BC